MRSKSSKAIWWLLRAREALDDSVLLCCPDSSLPPGPALHTAFPLSRGPLAHPSPSPALPAPRRLLTWSLPGSASTSGSSPRLTSRPCGQRPPRRAPPPPSLSTSSRALRGWHGRLLIRSCVPRREQNVRHVGTAQTDETSEWVHEPWK